MALTAKGKKKNKKGPKKGGAKQQDGQKKDLSTIKVLCMSKDGTLCSAVSEQEKKEATADNSFSGGR